MLALLGFCGASDSGKTTLVARVVEELVRRGMRVGVIKHHGHRGALQPEPPGADSQRLAAAGAWRVALVHEGGVWLTAAPLPGADDPRQVAESFLAGAELVLVEGYKHADIDKIEVVAPGREPMLPPGGRLLALARRGGGGREAGLPVLDADDPAGVAEFVTAHTRQARACPRVRLRVGGRELELAPEEGRRLLQNLEGLVRRPLPKGGEKEIRVEIQ